MSKEILGWWFGPTNNRLLNGDNRKIVLGGTHTLDSTGPRIVPCQYGLHASPTAFDALRYAKGPMLYRVKLSGIVVQHGNPMNKWAASERTYLDGEDATKLLNWFSRVCAIGVLKNWKTPVPDVVRHYLMTGDTAASNAAVNAASAAASAAWSAESAWNAAESAAWSAAESAEGAWNAVNAAFHAAESASSGAAASAWSTWNAARSLQSKWLEAAALQWIGESPHALDDLIAATKKK